MSVQIKNSITPAFARHETFTIRHGWLKRGFDAVAGTDEAAGNPGFFLEPDAHHRLGVGKNMAKSIRFWLAACRLVEEERHQRRSLLYPTPLGQALLGDGGLDPYLEDVGSWWLLHWALLSPGGMFPVWWVSFHTFGAVEFTTEQLVDHATAQVQATSVWSAPRPPTESSIRKDVLALLRTYAGTPGSRRADKEDDRIDAPLTPLTLVRATEDGRGFRFGVGPKPGLPPAVAAFACLDFLSRTGHTGKSALVATLTMESGGPGRALKLTERDLGTLLQAAADEDPDLLSTHQSTGTDVVSLAGEQSFSEIGAELLRRHYRRRGGSQTPCYGPLWPTRFPQDWWT